MPDQLPKRLRPVPDLRILRRGPAEVQVGLDPRLAAVATGLPEPVADALHGLRGRADTDELLAALGEHRPAMHAVLRALTARGLLEDGSRQAVPVPGRLVGELSGAAMRAAADADGSRDDPAARRGLAIAVHGDGRLAVAVACLLAGAGVGWVHVVAAGSVRPEDTGTGYLPEDVGRRRGAAARTALARVDAAVRTTAFNSGRGPHLVVLTDSLVHEPARIAALNGGGVPYLSVRMRDGIGIVGPLVVPGLTSCLLCADLQRCELDPHWPRIAVQLAGQTQLADLASTQATAALAVGQALDGLRWTRGFAPAPPSREATLELDLAAAVVRRRSWAAHSACSCGAAERCSNVAANTDEELRESST
jgi:bacteriocin biosynthesis cyclodehydratase domain-containing protein